MNDFLVYPIFSSPIALTSIETKNALDYFSKLKYQSATGEFIEEQTTTEVTDDFNILDNYSDLKTKILHKFINYKNNFLFLSSTEFKMTKSWAVRTKKGSYSRMHMHSNSYISGVLYLNGNSDSGHIEFESPILDQIRPVPTEYTLINSKSWSIRPEKGLLIFFPSYLNHRIKKHNSEEDRYSIAFNFLPCGKYGKGDSEITTSLI